MTYDIDSITILNAAKKLYGENVQIGQPAYIDINGEYITIYVTPFHCRGFKAKFYYKKGSFDPKDPDTPE